MGQKGGYRHGKRSAAPTVIEYEPEEMVAALRWFKEHEPTPGLDVSDTFKVFPTAIMRDHLTDIGLIEQCPARPLELIKWRTTEKGRAFIEANTPEVTNGHHQNEAT